MRYKRLDRVNTKKDKDGKYISNEKFLNPKVFMKQAKDMPLYRNIILNNSGFAKATSNNCLTHKERFLIALQADGHINKLTNKLDFHFSKQRKIDRLINILSNLEGYSYIKRDSKSDNTTYIIVTPPEGIQHTKQFDWVNLNTISKEWCLDFVLELLEWDGSKNANNPINGKYSSVLEYNVDIAQCVASMCGYKTRKTTVARDESRHCIYNLQLSKGEHFGVEKLKPELLPYKGFVYCVEVPTHNILVRRNGHVTVCGNSTRRGSLAAYLPIEHPDIMEFLDIRMEGCPLQNILSGVTVGNEWFEEMKAGDKGKRKVWAKLMKARAFAGVPYILFRDNANKNKPQVYKDKNMEIVASNLCVTGDQRVVSDRGLLTVKELYEQGGSLKLFDNDKIVNASPMQLIEKDADVFKITLENGLEHSITGYHKVSTKNGNVACSDLKVGDMVKVQTKSMYGDSSGYFPEYEDYYISFNSYSNGVGSKQEIYDALKNLTLEQKIFLASRGELINDDGCSKIVSIEHIGKEDVYCTTVDSQEHLWICNGFITSNCNEIMLPSSENESFVCVLSSINLLYYDEWKDTDAPEILLAFLDTVNEEFVIKTNNMPFMKRANRFAKRHRALGLGVLGWHSYLQKNMIPFGSFVAMGKTNEIFSKINDKTLNMTKQLASWFGEPELLKGYGERNTTRCALAPTKSSSFILGQVSQSIEPYHSNYFVDDKAKAQVVFKNPYLKEVLKKYDKDDQEVWDSIKDANGSVQHLKFLTDEEREVFKTFGEISQMDIIKQAGIRQKYIDQGQSLNLMIHPKCSAKDENQLYIASHEEGLKGLYYRKSFNAASEFRRELVSCSTCEG
jgi:ribonucleotide reductase alpha subunit